MRRIFASILMLLTTCTAALSLCIPALATDSSGMGLPPRSDGSNRLGSILGEGSVVMIIALAAVAIVVAVVVAIVVAKKKKSASSKQNNEE